MVVNKRAHKGWTPVGFWISLVFHLTGRPLMAWRSAITTDRVPWRLPVEYVLYWALTFVCPTISFSLWSLLAYQKARRRSRCVRFPGTIVKTTALVSFCLSTLERDKLFCYSTSCRVINISKLFRQKQKYGATRHSRRVLSSLHSIT